MPISDKTLVGKATLTGRRGQDINVPIKAIRLLGLRKGDLLLVYVQGSSISLEAGEKKPKTGKRTLS